MITKKWEMEESCQHGSCPPSPVWVKDLGTDEDGVRWLCEVKYMYDRYHPCFQVLFDTDDTEFDDPFCRRSVLEADDYWGAVSERYHSNYVRYELIGEVVEDFIKAHHIDPTK